MKRTILFVDPDTEQLDAYCDWFKNMSEALSLHVASSGEAAWHILSTIHPEVVFADAKLGDTDGCTFFEELKVAHPDVIRVLISEPVERKAAFKLMQTVHQFIPKPLSKQKLKVILLEALSFRDIMTDENVIQLVNDMKNIPSLPTLYNEIYQYLWSDNTVFEDIADLIAKDIGMASKILQLVNSAFLGVPRQVANIREAVSYLGLKMIRTLVLMIHIFDKTDMQILGKLNLSGLWDHSFKVARYADLIARDYGERKEFCETCFTAGLLHSIGRIIMAVNFPERYQQVVDASSAGDDLQRLTELERQFFGADHCEIGAYLLGIWGVPHSITNSVLYHNRPGEALENAVSPLIFVHLADVFAHEQGRDTGLETISFDLTTLEELEMGDQIEHWRELVAESDQDRDS